MKARSIRLWGCTCTGQSDKPRIRASEKKCSRAVVPNVLAPGMGFVEDSFSTDWGWGGGMVSGQFKHVPFIVHFISVIITSAPPQIIRH